MYYNILMKCNHGYHGYRGFCLTPCNLRVGYGYGVGKPDPRVTHSKPYLGGQTCMALVARIDLNPLDLLPFLPDI